MTKKPRREGINLKSSVHLQNGLQIKDGKVSKAPKERGPYMRSSVIMKHLGEANLASLIDLQLDLAINRPCSEEGIGAQQFLLSKALPPPRHETFVEISLVPMGSLQDVLENENRIFKAMEKGEIALEIGEKIFKLTEQIRHTLETSQIADLMKQIEQSVDDKIKEHLDRK